MHVTFGRAHERTLREMAALVRAAGWEIRSVTRSAGTVFGYVVAEPIDETQVDNLERRSPEQRVQRVADSEHGGSKVYKQDGSKIHEQDGFVREKNFPALQVEASVLPPQTATAPLLLPSPLILFKNTKSKISSTTRLKTQRSSNLGKSKTASTVSSPMSPEVAVEACSSPEGELWKRALQALHLPISPEESEGIRDTSGDVLASPSASLSPGSDGRTKRASGSGSGLIPWPWAHSTENGGAATSNEGDARRGDVEGNSQVAVSSNWNSNTSSSSKAASPSIGLGQSLKKMRSKTQLRHVLSLVDIRRGGSSRTGTADGAVAVPGEGEDGNGGRRQRTISRSGLWSRAGDGDAGNEVPPVPSIPPIPPLRSVPSVLERMRWRQKQGM